MFPNVAPGNPQQQPDQGKQTNSAKPATKKPRTHGCVHDELMQRVGGHMVVSPQRYRSQRQKMANNHQRNKTAGNYPSDRRDRKLVLSKSSLDNIRITLDWRYVDNPE